ncbi:M23 family metallopeptidase [Mangrovibacterium marinum]|uniref:Peptidase M23-like protein n=1 Tax=Mangrovibacterium marinum TaxID=1639118 RepID=A0A2T5BRW1_9BACT|nr:M23 family metallopeptidase [Mangrovibacterium marinum]PTN02043.1 peptidase M23-like protein [Mangrovibacterium marinum]
MKCFLFTLLLFLINRPYTPTIKADYFAAPVKIPMLLAGNFGELRSNHFHSGIDIKTQGKTGIPVYAPAEGTLSRIKISPWGFGTALYIDHPNGYTTVYGHLSALRDDLAKYARDLQYRNRSFELDQSVPAGKFRFKQGELIAYSGNSGSSGGPHLHFEIRDSKTQNPINPLLFNFAIRDSKAPKLMSVMLYPLSKGAHINGSSSQKPIDLVMFDGAYHLKSNPTITAGGEIGFGIMGLDYLDGSWSKCGIYEISLSVNGKLIYNFKLNEISFSQSRYINSYIDYTYLKNNRRRYQKNWIEEGNQLNNYLVRENEGKLAIEAGKDYEISYLVKDVYGNTSRLQFTVHGQAPIAPAASPRGIPVYHATEFKLQQPNVQAIMKAGTFYSDFQLDYKELPSAKDLFSKRIQLHEPDVPVHQAYKLRIKAESLPDQLKSKALLVAIDPKTGKKSSMGGQYSNGWVESQVRQLGTFAIATDTEAPSITPLNIKNHSSLTDRRKVSFKIMDDLSGVDSYQGEIDGQWVLFEYDGKNNLIEYYFDETRLQLGKSHQLKLRVNDGAGNQSTYQAKFYR